MMVALVSSIHLESPK